MLRSMEDLEDYAIGATDGVVGHVKDLYLDDEAWIVRCFVGHRRLTVEPRGAHLAFCRQAERLCAWATVQFV